VVSPNGAEWLPVPAPPRWTIGWDDLLDALPWLRALDGCPQEPTFHAEGDVLVHTRLVGDALVASPAWRGLPRAERRTLFAAALLHDVAKPERTRLELDGRISAPGHARRGAVLARRLLWEAGVPFGEREAICALVRHHQVPFYLLERPDARRLVVAISQTVRCDHLALLAEADARGRACSDPAGQPRLLDAVALFAEYSREQDCLAGPRQFPSDHARFLYFRQEGRDPDYRPHEAFRAEALVLSGLPGAGKDRWIAEHAEVLAGWAVVSVDALRAEMGVAPTGDQAAVVVRARERVREHLRRGRSLVWNATNLSRSMRRECIDLLADYGARIRVVYVEVPADRLYAQNRARSHPVPDAVIDRLLDRWDVPDLTEAHQVTYAVTGA
jgi:predicted kinase